MANSVTFSSTKTTKLVHTIKSIVIIFGLFSLTAAECQEVVASSSKIFVSSVTEFHIPASFETVAS